MAYPLWHPSSQQPRPLALTQREFDEAFPSENGYVERKTGVGNRALQETIVSFSNSDGGVILVGVRDDGHVVGRDLTPGTEDDLHRIFGEVRAPGRYDLHRLVVDGRPVVVIAVARRREGFAQTSEGRVLVRRGSRDVALFGSDLRRFLNERALERFEETDTHVPVADVSAELLAEIARAFGWRDETAIPERLVEHGLVTADARGTLTLAGALFLLDRPDARLGKAYVEVLRRPRPGAEYDRRIAIRGPLQRQLERATDFVMADLGTDLVVLGVRRHDLPRLPRVVLREAIANALAHRSYEQAGSSVRIELDGEAVTIVSPGGFPEPVTEQNIRDAQAARNLAVISVLRRLGLAEDAGRGVDVMEDEMRAEMLDPPRFRDTGHSVRVRLPTRSAVAPAERAWVREIEHRGLIRATDRLLLVHAARGEPLTNSRTRDLLGVDSHGARMALRRLRDSGLLVQRGRTAGASYELAGTLAPPAGLRLTPGELERLVLDLAVDGPVTNARVREATGLDRVESLRLLDRLVGARRLVRVGERRGTRYVLPNFEGD